MLTRVTIDGVRSCGHVVLDELGTVTALIGRNSAGKTNVLRGMLTLAKLACASGTDMQAWRDVPTVTVNGGVVDETPDAAFTAEIALNGAVYRYSLSAVRYLDLDDPQPELDVRLAESLTCKLAGQAEVHVFERDKEHVRIPSTGAVIALGKGIAVMPALAAVLPGDDAVLGLTEPLRRFLSRVRYYPLAEPADSPTRSWITEAAYQTWLAENNASGSFGANVTMQILHLARTNKERFAELNRQLGPHGLALVQDIQIHVFPEKPDSPNKASPRAFAVWFRRVGSRPGSGLHDFDELSQGTRRLVRLMTAFAFGDASVMLVEHPEDGIHKGLVRKVAGVFTAALHEAQVILATHSDTLMNQLPMESIRFVTMESGSTSVRKLSQEELSAAAEYIDSDVDGTLAEFLHSVED